MRQRGLRADESYWAVFVAGGVSGGGGGTVAAGAAGAVRVGLGFVGMTGAAETAAPEPFISAAGARLTVVTFPGGPTGGAVEAPTVTVSASGLPALSIGAVAVGGTA